MTARRTCGGMTLKLLTGGWPWRAPDGYLNKEIRLTELGSEEQLRHAKYKRWIEIDPDQAKVWRLAWQLLLTDRYSLAEICQILHERGYKTVTGRTFIKLHRVGKTNEGENVARIQILSAAFHNWFYAGWVVAQNDWVTIATKTIKGEWEPMVSTDDFERGLAILAERSHIPMPSKKHFYLLQGLVYLETDTRALRKLICSMPNANRTRGGVAYYCIASSASNFLCQVIDAQIPKQLQAIQVNPAHVPTFRKTYLADITRYTKDSVQDRTALEARKRKLEEKELNLWRAFTEHGMRAPVFESLTQECNEERQRLESLITKLDTEKNDYVANLDAALEVISQIGECFEKCTPEQQRAILLQMVERVVIDAEGQVTRLVLKPPFSYLDELKRQSGGGAKKQPKAKSPIVDGKDTGSLEIRFGGLGRNRTDDTRFRKPVFYPLNYKADLTLIIPNFESLSMQIKPDPRAIVPNSGLTMSQTVRHIVMDGFFRNYPS